MNTDGCVVDTPHVPTVRRTLSGKRVPRETPYAKTWHELVAAYKEAHPAPEKPERTGSWYQQEFPILTAKPVCPHCKKAADPDVECPATDSGNHEIRTHDVNRSMIRRAGFFTRRSKHTQMELGEAWVSSHEKE